MSDGKLHNYIVRFSPLSHLAHNIYQFLLMPNITEVPRSDFLSSSIPPSYFSSSLSSPFSYYEYLLFCNSTSIHNAPLCVNHLPGIWSRTMSVTELPQLFFRGSIWEIDIEQ